MNTRLIDAIAKAVLYEGYMLYPYRPSSVKNRQRFNFGVLYPKLYTDAQIGSDNWTMQTECIVEGAFARAQVPAIEVPAIEVPAVEVPAVEVRVRFLKLVARTGRDLVEPAAAVSPAVSTFGASSFGASPFESMPPSFGHPSSPWQEAIECEVTVPVGCLDALTETPLQWNFLFPAEEEVETLRDKNGTVVGIVDRKQESVHGTVEINATRAAENLFKLQVRVKNLTLLEDSPSGATRDSALMRSLVSAHVVLGVVDGQFISLLEPPEQLKNLVTGCENVGVWPVLVGADGERDTMLASPIILYDYPQIAPESPGDLFDGLEIDEILALRIMTMTDDEKREMRNTDDRARQILERTEALPSEHLAKLHGTLRDLRSLKEDMP